MSEHPTLPFGAAERWLPISGYVGAYEVSSLGRVRSLPRPWVPRLRILRLKTRHNGYLCVVLADPSKQGAARRRTFDVHQLVAQAFLGPRPEGATAIRHLDGNQINNTPENMRYGTHTENVLDAVRHGTHFNGSKTHCKWGHEFTPENTHIRARSGWRSCKACMRDIDRVRGHSRPSRN